MALDAGYNIKIKLIYPIFTLHHFNYPNLIINFQFVLYILINTSSIT